MAKSRDLDLGNKLFSCLQIFLFWATSCHFACRWCVRVVLSYTRFVSGLVQENLRFKFAISGKFRSLWNTLMQVWVTGYRRFLLEAIGLIVDEAELFFLFWATNCHFLSWGLELKLHKRYGLHVIWARESLVNAVSTLQPPLCITFIPMEMNLPFYFYLSMSFAETANLVV